jgi:hypothetical protein
MSEYSDALQVVIDEQRAELSAWRRLAEGLDGFFRVAEDARVFRVAWPLVAAGARETRMDMVG